MSLFAKPDRLIGALLFVLCMVVYAMTASPTISFWDCAEFIATAHTLGIPHQPGTPLYVLVGHAFSLLPLGIGIAHKINLMSAFFSALAVTFMSLAAVRLQRNWGDDPAAGRVPAWIGRVGAATGALFLAFSTTFWNNAIEAEVYALASFTLALTAYLSVEWYEMRDRAASATLMLLIVYLMGMSIGFHMGSILVFPGVFVLVMLARNKALKTLDLLLVAAVMAAFVLSTMKMPDFLVIALSVGAVVVAVWRSVTWGGTDEIEQNRYFALIGIGLFVLGISVHIFMLIRAHHDPLINQSDPTSFDALMSVLRREQYPPRSIFVREASLLWQFGQMWGSSTWESGQVGGLKTVGYLQQFTFLGRGVTLADAFVPLALWLIGAAYQLRHDWRLGASFLTTLLINSVGLMLVLNFTSSEVRDRDYFFFGFYQFAALFIALGVGGLLRSLWVEIGRSRIWLVRGAGAFLVLLPMLPVLAGFAGIRHDKWFEHDRSRNEIAYHYARNILDSVPPNSILCTYGDNDTFPLWYLQEVENFRTDVRVVNLSLVNLPWYIKQLRDYEPALPITWTDRQIEGKDTIRFRKWELDLRAQRMPDGSVAWIRDMVLWHVIQNNRWEQGIYFAITVPNDAIGMFYPYLEMEGMVFRLTPTEAQDDMPRVDVEKMWANFTELYDLTSVVDENGYADHSIYREPQTAHLLRNYPATLGRIGWFSAQQGDYERAVEALEWAWRLEPAFPVVASAMPIVYLQMGDAGAAMDAARRTLPHQTHPSSAALDFGDALISLKEDALAAEWGLELMQADPLVPDYVQLRIRALLLEGRIAESREAIEDWVQRTGDTSARQELERMIDQVERARAARDSATAPEGETP
jgi:tetratricopeptide (TPR) repeat protein